MSTRPGEKNPQQLCFVIGPMGGDRMRRLRVLAEDVIAPLVAPYNFTVETPDHSDIGRIMDQVLLSIEQADLLVADLTGNNPNVLYELAVYHGTGRPYLTVRDTSAGQADQPAPYDIQAYRHLDVSLANAQQAREAIAPTIRTLFEEPDERNWYSNPITDFYHAPVTHLRYASALAENYHRNFLRKVLDALYEDEPSLVVDGTPAPADSDIRIDIVIPDDLNHARHRYINRHLIGPGHLVPAHVGSKSRPFSLYAHPRSAGGYHLVDVPTILATVRESVEQRMGPRSRQGRVNKEERGRLEHAEIRRFCLELDAELDGLIEERMYDPDRIRIVRGYAFTDAS